MGFHPDSDQFLLGEAEVDEVLQPIADFLKAYPDTELMLIGTTAGDKATDYSYELSQKRAEAVKNRLVSLGCDASRLTAIGLSCNDPWHVYGAGTSGPLASSNRKVVLLDKASTSADEVLAIYRENRKP